MLMHRDSPAAPRTHSLLLRGLEGLGFKFRAWSLEGFRVLGFMGFRVTFPGLLTVSDPETIAYIGFSGLYRPLGLGLEGACTPIDP